MALPWGTLAALLVVAGVEPAAAGAFAGVAHDSILGHVQLPFPG